jgi:PKD repeat protein
MTKLCFSQCNSLFSFAAYFETVSFFNQSNVSNAHYFWDFGDGTGSNYDNPIHKYPETGKYFVTLFSVDTNTGCSSFYEYQVSVSKYSTNTCLPSVYDSSYINMGNTCFKLIDNSSNCSADTYTYDLGIAFNVPASSSITFSGFWRTVPFNMLGRGRYYDSNFNLIREAYKTVQFNYSSSSNYNDCSANFEFITMYRNTNGERVLFRAMNKSAISYQWNIMGFGPPITSTNDTISVFYPYANNNIWIVGLNITGQQGCKDTVYHNILVKDSVETIANMNEVLIRNNEFDLFPNPNMGVFTIKTDAKNYSVEIYNTMGQQCLSLTLSQGDGTNVIDLSAEPKGIYFVKVMENEKYYLQKIVIQ